MQIVHLETPLGVIHANEHDFSSIQFKYLNEQYRLSKYGHDIKLCDFVYAGVIVHFIYKVSILVRMCTQEQQLLATRVSKEYCVKREIKDRTELFFLLYS